MLTFLLLISAVCIVFPQPAHAYIDPCAGGYIVQAVFGSILVAGATVRSLLSLKKKPSSSKKFVLVKQSSELQPAATDRSESLSSSSGT